MATTIQKLLEATEVNEHTSEAQRADPITLADETALAVTTTGSWVDVGEGRNLALALTISAVTGTSPTFNVTLETSSDKGVTDTPRALNSLATAGAFAQQIAAGTVRKCFGPTDRYVRCVITLGGGTPVGTIKVSGKVN
jgi:hypothetical protein